MSDVGFLCVDCGVNTRWHTGIGEYYHVHDAIWAAAGMKLYDGMLCVGCLERRLGRELHGGDISAAPINVPHPANSERLNDRLLRVYGCETYNDGVG